MTGKSPILALILSILALTISLIMFFRSSESDIVIVDIKYLFENFELKKQLQGEFDNTVSLRKRELDELNSNIQKYVSTGAINGDSLELMKQYLTSKASEYQETNVALSKELDNKIHTQLKHYLKEYLEKNGVEILVCETPDELNIIGNETRYKTKEVLKYINESYKDQNEK